MVSWVRFGGIGHHWGHATGRDGSGFFPGCFRGVTGFGVAG